MKNRHLVLITTAALLASACGGGSGTEAGSSQTSPSAAVTESSSAAEASESASGASEADAAEGDGEPPAAEAAEDGDCSGTYSFESYSGPAEVPRDPENIAVLDLGMLTSFDELGVPIDEADGFASLGIPLPDDVQALADIPLPLGTAFEPDLEALSAMEPDLIVVASRSSRLHPDLVDLDIAPVVDLTSFDGEGTDFFEEFATTHRHIGEIFCVQDAVEAELAELQGRIDAISAAASDAGDALVLVTTGAEVTAFGPGAFRFGQVFDTYGFSSADDSLAREETHGEPVSFEFIAEAAPEVLFVVDRAAATGDEGETAAAILDNALVNATPAGENGAIHYVDSFDWYIVFNGIVGVRGVIEDLSAAVSG